MLSGVGKIYAGILEYGVHKVTEGLIDDKQGVVHSREGLCRSDLYPKAER